jgi:hypothetical protein
MEQALRAGNTPKEITVSAIITRANGKVENLGTVSYWHRSIFKRALYIIKKHFKGERYAFIRP